MKLPTPTALIATALLIALGTVVSANVSAESSDQNWPQWRGPAANGVAPGSDPPASWSEDQNIAWKVELPGRGSSTPVIWGDRLYLTTTLAQGKEPEPPPEPAAEPGQRRRRRPRALKPTQEHQYLVLAIDRNSGKTVWQTVVRQSVPHDGTHPFGNFATGSPVTDGQHLWAFFGSAGLYCLDMSGKVIWEKDFGDQQTHNNFGEGASPALAGDLVVVPWDHNGQSFVVALDKLSGDERWRANREEITSWSTPLVVEHDGTSQVITNATNKIRSYDLASGELIWESTGMTRNVIPTPVEMDGVVYIMSGFRGSALQAIELSKARGDITASDAIVWSMDRDTPYTASPLLYEGRLYFLKVNSNILTVVNAKSGEQLYQARLEGLGDVFSSPVGADGRVYITDRDGNTIVISSGDELNVLSTNSLDDAFDASMAVVGDEIYLRGRNLYRVSE